MSQAPLTFHRYDYAAFLTYASYACCSVIVPVSLVHIAKSLDFPLDSGGMSSGGLLHMGRTVSMVVLLILGGFIAGRWGKRRTMGLFLFMMAFGILICACAPSYLWLMPALLIAGAGEGYLEAIATPFVQDLHPRESGRYLNFTHGFWSVGVMAAMLAGGAALSVGISWRIVVGFAAAIALIPGFLLVLPEKKGKEYPEHPEKLSVRTVTRQSVQIMKKPKFWLFFSAMFLAGGGEFCLTFWLATFMQLEMKSGAWMGGVATAVFAAGMAIGRTGWGVLISQKKLAKLVIWSAVAGTVLSLPIPFLHPGCMPRPLLTVLLMTLLFLIGVATAPFWPSIQSYSVDRIKGTDSTMMFVLLSCAGVPGCGVFAWGMGIAGDHWGLSRSFFMVPACYLILAGLMIAERGVRRRKKSARRVRV